MVQVLRSKERGHANFGWLDTHHSFSFGDYYDPKRMGFRALRVINEDTIDGGAGFPMHPHRDMEIITIVTEGALEHRDSMGNSTRILPGEVQKMSAGTGVRHSEFNPLAQEKTHLFQIWIVPDKEGYLPDYGQRSFAEDLKQKSLVLAVSPDGREGSILIRQDANLYLGHLKAGQELKQVISPGRHLWLQMIRGELKVSEQILKSSDALAVSQKGHIDLQAQQDSEFILFDLN